MVRQESRNHLDPKHGCLTQEQHANVTAWVEDASAPRLALAEDDMIWAMRTAARSSAPGPLGWRTQHWKRLCVDYKRNGGTKPLTCFTAWANGALMTGHLDKTLRELWGSCVTIMLTKKAGGHRPVSMGNVERRIMGRAAKKLIRSAAEERFRGAGDSNCLQLGSASPRTAPSMSSTTSTCTSSSTPTTS